MNEDTAIMLLLLVGAGAFAWHLLSQKQAAPVATSPPPAPKKSLEDRAYDKVEQAADWLWNQLKPGDDPFTAACKGKRGTVLFYSGPEGSARKCIACADGKAPKCHDGIYLIPGSRIWYAEKNKGRGGCSCQ